MAKEFEGKVVYITGAAKGQGKAIALAFAREGADIIAFDLGEKLTSPAYNDGSSKDLEALKAEIEALGRKCVTFAGDEAAVVAHSVDGGARGDGHGLWRHAPL